MRARQQRGSGLVLALFVIVAGATIALVLVSTFGAGQQARNLGLLQSRAQQAAQTGLEWARYRIDRSGNCAAGVLNLREGALTGFRTTVSCTRSTHNDGGTTRRVYALSAFAQRGRFGDPEYASWRATQNLQR